MDINIFHYQRHAQKKKDIQSNFGEDANINSNGGYSSLCTAYYNGNVINYLIELGVVINKENIE